MTGQAEPADEFAAMITHLTGQNLPQWIDTDRTTGLPGIASFAKGLEQDLDAVTNGLTMNWNSGPVDGRVNHIKMMPDPGTDHSVRTARCDPHLNPLTCQGRLIEPYDVCMSDGSRSSEEMQTARLSLLRPTAADIDAIFEIHSDSRTCLHNPSDRLTRRERAEELYQRWNEQWQRCGYGYWVVRCRGSALQLGFCGIKPMELNSMKILNLFYRFTPSAWGHGLAGEAATAVAAWASRQVPDLPLIARVRPANVASQRVAIRAGLTRAEHLDTTGYDGADWIFAANLPD